MAEQLAAALHAAGRHVSTGMEAARVMVACGSAALADPVLQTLQGEVESVFVAPRWHTLAADFDAHRPDVLIFAFESLARSQAAQRELYRLGAAVLVQPHRTLVLCQDNEVQAAYELCRQGHFDDFVPWGAEGRDTRRLVMSVRTANRKLTQLRPATPTLGELLAHLRHLGEVEHLLGRLHESNAAGDAEALAARLAELKAPLDAALAGSRQLQDKVARMRPLVLVVDDDALARQLITRALDPQAYELRYAGDGIEALNQLRRMRPDVILMDVRMPGLDGVSLTQRLKAEPQLARIPIILMTGDSSRQTLASSIDVGAAAFLLKPYTRESLTAKLEKVLGLHGHRH
jgi:CheY-like chemotaxis protein